MPAGYDQKRPGPSQSNDHDGNMRPTQEKSRAQPTCRSKSALLRLLHSGQLSVMTTVVLFKADQQTPAGLSLLHVMFQQLLQVTAAVLNGYFTSVSNSTKRQLVSCRCCCNGQKA